MAKSRSQRSPMMIVFFPPFLQPNEGLIFINLYAVSVAPVKITEFIRLSEISFEPIESSSQVKNWSWAPSKPAS